MKLEEMQAPARTPAVAQDTSPPRKARSAPGESASPDPALAEHDLSALWRHWKQTGDQRARNVLLLHYQPLVKQAARSVKSRLPRGTELADLQSAGFFGLCEAVQRFDPSRGVKFEAYCGPRVRGAILDECRSLDWIPRSARVRAHQLEAARSALEAKLGRRPRPAEIADKLGCSLDEYLKLAKRAKTVGVFHVSRTPHDEESSKGLADIDGLQDPTSEDPSTRAEEADFKQLVTKGLSGAERLMMTLYYYQDMTMREIGRTLRLSESRVCQMHASILDRLRRNRGIRREALSIAS